MALGDPAVWGSRYRSLDTRLLECIISIWPDCLAVLPPTPMEDEITVNLAAILAKNPEARRLFHWLEYQYEPFGYSSTGTAYSKGKIDMAVLLDQERERYLPYECKRLNVPDGRGARSSLATPYVTDGVKRYVTEQYAEGLPVGCMLGYVMDGDISFAKTRVYAAIATNGQEVKLRAGPISTDPVDIIKRFVTKHLRANASKEIG